MSAVDPGRAIISEVAAKHGFGPREILENTRAARVVKARDEAIRRIRIELDYSFPRIARLFGRTDHTTFWAAFNRDRKREQNTRWVRKTRAAAMEARA